jgi:hypothetical protein
MIVENAIAISHFETVERVRRNTAPCVRFGLGVSG